MHPRHVGGLGEQGKKLRASLLITSFSFILFLSNASGLDDIRELSHFDSFLETFEASGHYEQVFSSVSPQRWVPWENMMGMWYSYLGHFFGRHPRDLVIHHPK